MSSLVFKAKPYKLKPSEGYKITRDDVTTWSYTIQSCARQVTDWIQFLPNSSKSQWTAKSEDPTHNLKVTKDEDGRIVDDVEGTDRLRAHFQDFLTFVASHCPSGFMSQVMRESTSYDWIIEQLYSTYGLETKGENFLAGNDINFEFSPSFTHSQALMQLKDFYVNSLLSRGSTFKGKTLNKDEELSPMAENFIIEKCLSKIDHRLPDHIKHTRGHLFTEERPTLACNQKILFSQIDTMLAELEGKETTGLSVGQVRAGRYQPRPPRPTYRGRGTGFRFPHQPMPRQTNYYAQFQPRTASTRPPASMRPTTRSCIRCMEARRYDAARFHHVNECPYPRQQRNNNGMKVFVVQDSSSQQGYEEMQQYDGAEYDYEMEGQIEQYDNNGTGEEQEGYYNYQAAAADEPQSNNL